MIARAKLTQQQAENSSAAEATSSGAEATSSAAEATSSVGVTPTERLDAKEGQVIIKLSSHSAATVEVKSADQARSPPLVTTSEADPKLAQRIRDQCRSTTDLEVPPAVVVETDTTSVAPLGPSPSDPSPSDELDGPAPRLTAAERMLRKRPRGPAGGDDKKSGDAKSSMTKLSSFADRVRSGQASFLRLS